MAKPINNYILLVDAYRRPSRRRNTSGRYRVGAKTEKEAIALLRERIKFGSIQVYYKCDLESDKQSGRLIADYKQVVQETGSKDTPYLEPTGATEPQIDKYSKIVAQKNNRRP